MKPHIVNRIKILGLFKNYPTVWSKKKTKLLACMSETLIFFKVLSLGLHIVQSVRSIVGIIAGKLHWEWSADGPLGSAYCHLVTQI